MFVGKVVLVNMKLLLDGFIGDWLMLFFCLCWYVGDKLVLMKNFENSIGLIVLGVCFWC